MLKTFRNGHSPIGKRHTFEELCQRGINCQLDCTPVAKLVRLAGTPVGTGEVISLEWLLFDDRGYLIIIFDIVDQRTDHEMSAVNLLIAVSQAVSRPACHFPFVVVAWRVKGLEQVALCHSHTSRNPHLAKKTNQHSIRTQPSSAMSPSWILSLHSNQSAGGLLPKSGQSVHRRRHVLFIYISILASDVDDINTVASSHTYTHVWGNVCVC